MTIPTDVRPLQGTRIGRLPFIRHGITQRVPCLCDADGNIAAAIEGRPGYEGQAIVEHLCRDSTLVERDRFGSEGKWQTGAGCGCIEAGKSQDQEEKKCFFHVFKFE